MKKHLNNNTLDLCHYCTIFFFSSHVLVKYLWRRRSSMSRLFHPDLHSHLAHGGFVRTTIEKLYQLDFTHLGYIVAVAGIIPAAWVYIRSAWRETSAWVRHFFIASVSIPAHDPVNRSVSTWLHEHVIEPRRLRFHIARTEPGRTSDPGAALKKSAPVQYLPQWQNIWFRHEAKMFAVSRDGFSSSSRDSDYDGFGGGELCISCLGISSEPIKKLIETCRLAADQQAQFYVIIYCRDRYGMNWKPRLRRPLRRIDTVHFDERVKKALMTDIKTYLDPRTQKLYQSRSMPYRRGYLFYGPPGSGKSSLSTAIASEFGLDLYEVKIPSISSDADLEQMFSEVPPRCIVLLEDIDAVWTGRERQLPDSDDESSNSSSSNVTLSGLLNVLDGVGSQEGRIVVMTTNRLEELDSALIRPGRVDLKVHLGLISQQSARDMFISMFAPDLLHWARISSETVDTLEDHVSLEQVKILAAQFSEQIPEDTFTPSQLQGFFQLHLKSAVRATSSIAAWVKQQRLPDSEKEFEVC